MMDFSSYTNGADDGSQNQPIDWLNRFKQLMPPVRASASMPLALTQPKAPAQPPVTTQPIPVARPNDVQSQPIPLASDAQQKMPPMSLNVLQPPPVSGQPIDLNRPPAAPEPTRQDFMPPVRTTGQKIVRGLETAGIGLAGGFGAARDFVQATGTGPNSDAEKKFEQAHGTWQGDQDAARRAEQDDLNRQNVQSEIGRRDVQNQKDQNPPEKPEKFKAIQIAGPNGEAVPAIQYESGRIVGGNGQEIQNPKMWEKPAAASKESLDDQLILSQIGPQPQRKSYPSGPGGDASYAAALKSWGAAGEAIRKPNPDTSAKDNARTDRSYQFNAKELDEERKPLEATMQKISAGMTNLNLKSAQADAFLAPQILTLSAGGSGSGLRMNEAEIKRILAGRTAWEDLKAVANKWIADPQHVQIPEEQRQAMADILTAAQAKGTLKSSILEWADGALVNTEDVKTHRTIVAQARKLMNAVDEGKRVQRNKTTGEFRIAPGE